MDGDLLEISSTNPFKCEIELGYQTILRRPHRHYVFKKLWGLMVSSFRLYVRNKDIPPILPSILSTYQDIVKYSLRKTKELLGTTIIESPEKGVP